MISLKELKYVDTWARNAPYPGEKYAIETLENMMLLLEKYNKNYKGKNYSIIFSDATECEFKILDSNICHMLGVDFKWLIGGTCDIFLKEVLGLDRTTEKITSYYLITKIFENYEEVIKYDESASQRVLNYYKSRIKCSIFEKINEFEDFNFGKLDSEDGTKILYTPSNESICPYFLVRLGKDETEESYSVISLLAPEEKGLKSFFEQKASIPTQIIIDDNQNLNKIEASPKEKINLLNEYKSIINSYGMPNKLDISGDYLSTLTELDNNQKRLRK